MWTLVVILNNFSGGGSDIEFYSFHYEQSCLETVEKLERLNPNLLEAFCVEDVRS